MRKIIGTALAGLVAGGALLLGSGVALADTSTPTPDPNITTSHGNPNNTGQISNPYAEPGTGGGPACVHVYQAPPAQGGPVPGSPDSNAAGGTPGYVDNGYRGPGC